MPNSPSPESSSARRILRAISESDSDICRLPRGVARALAEAAGVSVRYISMAWRLEREAPDLADKVRSGELSLPRADREYRRRAGMTNRECPNPAPAGTADLLADALAVALGPNARVFADRPRDWQAIRAAADEIVKGGAGA